MRNALNIFGRVIGSAAVLSFPTKLSGSIYFNMGAEYIQGTFTPAENAPATGGSFNFDLGYTLGGDSASVFAGGAGRYASLLYTKDGIRKPGSLFESGIVAGAGLFGDSLMLSVAYRTWPLSSLYVYSDSYSTVNNVKYRTRTISLYNKGVGQEGEVFLGFHSHGKRDQSSKNWFGLIVSGYKNVFRARSDRIVIDRSVGEQTQTYATVQESSTLILLGVGLGLGKSF